MDDNHLHIVQSSIQLIFFDDRWHDDIAMKKNRRQINVYPILLWKSQNDGERSSSINVNVNLTEKVKNHVEENVKQVGYRVALTRNM